MSTFNYDVGEAHSQPRSPLKVGDSVWFFTVGHQVGQQPFHAQIVYVHSLHLVNLTVWDANGTQRGITSVPFIQPGEMTPGDGSHFCRWPDPPKMGGEGLGLPPEGV